MCVTPHHFAEQLEVLRKYGRPMSLQRLARGHCEGDLPHRAVVITFDDGYADNLHGAQPLLERYDTPATLFLTTGQIGCEDEFWWDELERLLLKPGRIPDTLRLRIAGRTYQWDLRAAAYYSQDDYRSSYRQRAWQGCPGSRHALYYSIWQLLQPLREVERREALAQLRTWAHAEAVVRSTHRPLSLDEVYAIKRRGLIEIGAHTVTHPFLSAHPVVFQHDEIQRSKAYLEEILGHSVASFAYPYGDYAPETVAAVREAGFVCACSTVAESVWPQTDRFLLPRVCVQDWNGEEFAKRLLAWWFVC
jgi:peptidoglycan/xylan/chitin deacetylase (PgdA/CDA1 family)